MLTCTPKFLRAIRNSGKRKTVINVSESFGTSYLFENINIMGGSMVMDRNSDVRRTANLEIGDTALNDLFFTNPTGPFGVEIEIHSGVVYPDGSEELLKMGVFSVEDYSFEDVGGTGWPQMQLFDRSQWIHRSPFEVGRDFSGMLAQSVIEQVIEEVIPTVTIQFEPGLDNPRLPGGSMYDASRWDVVKACCELLAAEAYFDENGVLQVAGQKDPTAVASAASWEFNVGSGFSEIQSVGTTEELVRRPEGVLTNVQRAVTRASTFNAVSVYGAAPSATVGQPYAVATDADPNSPTYYEGPFGKSTKRIENQLLTTTDACAQAATAELKNVLGLSRSLDFRALSNPAIVAGDYVLFTFPGGSQEVHLLDSCTHALGAGEFSGATRTNPTRQTASVSVTRGTNTFDLRPEAPGKPQVLGVTNNSITVSWTASQAGSTDVVKYEILINHIPRRTLTVASGLAAVVGGLYPGNTYTITVRAIDAAGLVSNESLSTSQKTTGTYIADPGVGGITYTKTYPAFWSATYLGSSSSHHNERAEQFGTNCYQGDGAHGNYRSLIGFDEGRIATDLLGADIIACSVKLYYFQWEDPDDHAGTAIIGTHKFFTRPNIWSATNVKPDRIRSGGWKQGTSRTVSLGKSVGEEFASGLSRGIAIGPAPSNQVQYLGGAKGASSGSLSPQLIIVYKK